jgi:ribosomal-protein-alanine N-acetyltransferase
VLPTEIQTERLFLRPIRLTDAADVYAYASDPEWGRYLPVPEPYERSDAERFVAASVLTDRSERSVWGIALNDCIVGSINIRFFYEWRLAEIGYSMGRHLWGKGYTTEAARAVVDAAFAAYPRLMRVRAHADARNEASARVMEKLGMTCEGTLRCNRYFRGQFVDEVCYGVLRNEWAATRA